MHDMRNMRISSCVPKVLCFLQLKRWQALTTCDRNGLITRRSQVRVLPPLVDGSLRNPPTPGLTTETGTETRRRSRFNVKRRKGLHAFRSYVVSLPDGRATWNEAALHKRSQLRADSLGVSALLAPSG